MRARDESRLELSWGRWSLLAIAALFTALSLAAFGWSFGGPFDFDDIAAIVKNQTIQSDNFARAPLATPPLGTATSGRPVVNISFALNGALNRALGIDSPTGVSSPNAAIAFRLTNLLLHVMTALVLFVILRDTLGAQGSLASVGMTAAVVAVWLIHPLQTEAVNYVAQRTEIVASLCYLVTLFAAIRHRREPHATRWIVVATIAALLGAGSKEIIVTVPIVVVLYDRAFAVTTWPDVFKPHSRRWLYALLVAAVLPCVIADLRGARAATVGTGTGMSTVDYLVTQGWAIPHYVRLMLVPVGLSYDYGRSPMLGVSSWIGLVTLVVCGAIAVALWRSPRRHWLAFLVTTFFLLLAPSSSFVPIRTEVAAERRVYLALAVVVIVVVVAMMNLVTRTYRSGSIAKAMLAAIVVGLVITSARRSALYRDPLLLWTDATLAMPTNARAFDNAGAALLRADSSRYAEADALFAHALALDSTYVESWIRRAAIAMKQDRLGDAERMYLRALRLAPSDSQATSHIAKLYLAAGQPQRAIPYLRELAARSDDPDALTDLGNAYFLLRQLDTAAMILNRALSVNPRNGGALRWMGATLLEQGNATASIPYLEHALWSDTTSAFVYALLASAYGQSGRGDYAKRAARAAVAHARGDPGVTVLSARGLLAAGDLEGAEELLGEAVRMDPRDAELWTRLAIIQARRGRRADALMSVKQALAIAPDYLPARETLGRLR